MKHWLEMIADHKILGGTAAYALIVFAVYVVSVTVEPMDGENFETKLAIGQVVIGCLAVSIGIPGGYTAIREFQEATARPKLKLEYERPEGDDDEEAAERWQLAAGPKPGETLSKGIRLVNEGDAAARFWRLTLELEAVPGVKLTTQLPGAEPDPNNVSSVDPEGRKVAYPGSPVSIGQMQVTNDASGRATIRYSIATDRSRVAVGELFIVPLGEDAA